MDYIGLSEFGVNDSADNTLPSRRILMQNYMGRGQHSRVGICQLRGCHYHTDFTRI